jgi:hypothetical protein
MSSPCRTPQTQYQRDSELDRLEILGCIYGYIWRVASSVEPLGTLGAKRSPIERDRSVRGNAVLRIDLSAH